MHEYSTVDGFIEITESLGDMIKSLANEPSVGLFYIQQHTQSAVPNLVNLRNNIVGKSHEMSLHTQDSEESITIVRSMKECGFPIADDMIMDIKKSLAIMSAKEPKRGLLSNSPRKGFQMGRTSSWGPSTWGGGNVERTPNYLSTVFKSAKEKASNLVWSPIDTRESMPPATGKKLFSYMNPQLQTLAPDTSTVSEEREGDELPISNQIADELQDRESEASGSLSVEQLLSLSEDFDEFRADKEAKLEEWLGSCDNQVEFHRGENDAEEIQLGKT